MKNKFTKIISFLLVLILLISFPLESQANALAAESWLIYAIITYMTAVGFTFTVSGGVDSMINALEEKANEYSNNIIDFYDIMRQNIKFVPNPNRPPNSELLSLFFTAVGVEAMSEFLTWLTTDGGWGEGNSMTNSVKMFLSSNNNGETYEPIYLSESEYIATISSNVKHYRIIGQPSIVTDGILISGSTYQLMYNPTGYRSKLFEIRHNTNRSDSDPHFWEMTLQGEGSYALYQSIFPSGYSTSDVIGATIILRSDEPTYRFAPALVFSDNTCLTFSKRFNMNYVEVSDISESYEVKTPSDVIKPLPTVQEGLLMSNVELGSKDAIEWANKVEELFIETGTIPNPQPEIVQDPDFVPSPTPVPTPVPSPEIEDIDDLGLPTLGDAIFSKFPFSLPKDVGRIFTLLHADPVTPYWQVDLTGSALGIPSNFEVDLAQYEVLGQITRWFSVVSYCLFLILITRRMIKW